MGMRTWCGENEAFGRSRCVGSISRRRSAGTASRQRGGARAVGLRQRLPGELPAPVDRQLGSATTTRRTRRRARGRAARGARPTSTSARAAATTTTRRTSARRRRAAPTPDGRPAEVQGKVRGGGGCASPLVPRASSDDANRPNCLPVFGHFEARRRRRVARRRLAARPTARGMPRQLPTGLTSGVD